ncbi:hypothetical protein [Microbispora amethystogenes]|nr:hypothetical protein [Microbispora amethystogenes]
MNSRPQYPEVKPRPYTLSCEKQRREQLLFFALGLAACVPIGVFVDWIS